jgi:hypothetical protein
MFRRWIFDFLGAAIAIREIFAFQTAKPWHTTRSQEVPCIPSFPNFFSPPFFLP